MVPIKVFPTEEFQTRNWCMYTVWERKILPKLPDLVNLLFRIICCFAYGLTYSIIGTNTLQRGCGSYNLVSCDWTQLKMNDVHNEKESNINVQKYIWMTINDYTLITCICLQKCQWD